MPKPEQRTLENTTWKMQIDDGGEGDSSSELKFGPITAPPGCIGGSGSMTDSEGTSTPFVWVEEPDEYKFMIQLQNQSSDYSTLTTYSGSYSIVEGGGWFTNFNINFSHNSFSMTRV